MYFDRVLSLLENGDWHDVRDLPEAVDMPEVKTGIILAFLAEYGFIELDDKKERARATELYLAFLRRIKWAERADAAARRLE